MSKEQTSRTFLKKYRNRNEGKADTGWQNDSTINIERSVDLCVGELYYYEPGIDCWNIFNSSVMFFAPFIPIQFCSSIIIFGCFFPFILFRFLSQYVITNIVIAFTFVVIVIRLNLTRAQHVFMKQWITIHQQ